jgi:hypothetical protein
MTITDCGDELSTGMLFSLTGMFFSLTGMFFSLTGMFLSLIPLFTSCCKLAASPAHHRRAMIADAIVLARGSEGLGGIKTLLAFFGRSFRSEAPNPCSVLSA